MVPYESRQVFPKWGRQLQFEESIYIKKEVSMPLIIIPSASSIIKQVNRHEGKKKELARPSRLFAFVHEATDRSVHWTWDCADVRGGQDVGWDLV